jgi:hypothetical protein
MFLNNLIVSTLLIVALILPDLILGHWLNLISARIDNISFIIITLLCFLLSFVKQRKFFAATLSFLFFSTNGSDQFLDVFWLTN